MGSIPTQGTEIPQDTQHGQILKNKTKTHLLIFPFFQMFGRKKWKPSNANICHARFANHHLG